ncbi:MAG: tetratricopeptide repeat protein, partial [Phormidium sp.]
MFDAIIKFYQEHKETIDNLLSGALATILSTILFGGIGVVWWFYQNYRKKRIPHSSFAFNVIPPKSEVLPVIFREDDEKSQKDPLADSRIPYQRRLFERNIQKELERKLQETGWLLIVGRTGLGKTREAAELAQLFNNDGWTVLHLKTGEWLDIPARLPKEVETDRKLLFFLDDLHQKMHQSCHELSPKAENSPLEKFRVPLQERLLETLEAYEKLCGKEEICVIATTRNEKARDIAGEPCEWEKLQWDKYPKLWQRFAVYELPQPKDEAIVELLQETIPNTKISAQDEDYPKIARTNDGTFRNVVENLRRLCNGGLPLNPQTFADNSPKNWKRCYDDAVKRYPVSRYIYDAVELLQLFDLPLERFTVEPTAMLMVPEKFLQRLWYRWQIREALNYLIERQRILEPRDGQIQAKARQVDVGEYLWRFYRLVLKLAGKHPQSMLDYLFIFGNYLHDSSCYKEAIVCYDKALEIKPDFHEAWYNRGVTLGNLGRYSEAIDYFDKALEIKPDFHEAWNNRGVTLGNLGRYSEAIDSYDKALEIKLDYHEAWNNRGNALNNLGRYSEAINSFDKALEFKPDFHEAWYNRGVALNNLGRDLEAINSFDKALEFKPDFHEAWYNRGVALGNLGRWSEAIDSYDKA